MTTKQSGRHGLADSEIRSKMLPCTHRGRHSWQSNLKSQTRTNNNASLIDWVWSRFWIQQSWSLDSHLCTPDWNLDFTFNDTSENEWHWAHGKQSRKKKCHEAVWASGKDCRTVRQVESISQLVAVVHVPNWGKGVRPPWKCEMIYHWDHWMWNLSERTTPSTESESTSPQSPLSPLMTTAWQMEDCNSTNWHCPWQNWIIAVSQSHSIMIPFAKCQDTSKGLHTAVLLEGSNLFVQACGSVSAAAIWLMHLYIEFQHANNLLEAAQGSLCSRVCGTIFHMQQFVGVVFRPSESSSHIFWAFRPLLFCSLLPNPVVDIPFPYRSTGTLSITITITITSTNFIGTSFRHGKPKWPMGTCLHYCKV